MTAAVREPEPYEWRTSRDRDADVIAVLAAALTSDYHGAVSVLQSLDREALTSLLWCLSCWFAGSLCERGDDPVADVQRLALLISRERKDGTSG